MYSMYTLNYAHLIDTIIRTCTMYMFAITVTHTHVYIYLQYTLTHVVACSFGCRM